MFSELSVFHFLIYAAGIGFSAAIIYTNIQRTAFSNFINYLIDNKSFNETSAVTLSDIHLSTVQAFIIKSALKKQHGFKRSLGVICDINKSKIKTDEFFESSADNTKYYICDSDIEALRKKYSYKTMPLKFVVIFVAALLAVVIICSSLVGMLLKSVSLPKLDDSNNNITDFENSEFSDEVDASEKTDAEDNNTQTGDSAEQTPAGPRIPV